MSLLGLRSAKKKKGDGEAAEKPKKEKKAKAKKEKKAKAPKPAAAPKAAGVAVEKPPANIYTAMLVVSLVAVIIGCVMLYLEMNAYEWKMGPG